MTDTFLERLVAAHRTGDTPGIAAICSAHPIVLEAALSSDRTGNGPVLIEATCNQVNQEGGYTGMTPAAFRDFVHAIAERTGFDRTRLILGGDHLGPNPWRDAPAEVAMDKARTMVADYARAGFIKIHLDASMACADDPLPLPEDTIARRAAELARVAEDAAAGQRIVYVIGTEVPPPGGATEHIDTLAVTPVDAARKTFRLHETAFADLGLSDAFARIVGLVVQPGVEFGNENVIAYDPAKADALARGRRDLPVVYEAHSTDYQSPKALAALVRDGFAILKVGPWLTFALREGFYALEQIARELGHTVALRDALEAAMTEDPRHWAGHYRGDSAHQALQRHFSFSDRIRYYWPAPKVQAEVKRLTETLAGLDLPQTLVSQYMPDLWPDVLSGALPPRAEDLLRAKVRRVIDIYDRAGG